MSMKPNHAAGLSIISNSLIVLLKFVTGLFTGSVAILSEAIHSSLDLMASVMAYFSVRMSKKPPDRDHPYGHGKIENISGTIETLLIVVAGIWIIIESTKKLLNPEPIHFPIFGVAVMFIGALVNWFVGRIVKRVGEESKSVAMRSNALHLLTDVYSSIGVAASLLLVSITDLYILDPLIGIGIALFIMKEAFQLGKESFQPLLDASLEPEEEEQVRDILQSYADEYIEYHALRTRRSGPEEHIDLHLIVPSEMRVDHAHHLCDQIEGEIQKTFPRAQVLIHVEPEYEKQK
ncbi:MULTISPECIES: cation diffusion facilitator family transporter [Thermoactinomycetaceae]|nr:CDF family cation diffusion facilitator [Desmospora sp. 8437]QKI82380.1 cation transporter [Kroppenstedtia eburnea]